MVIQTIPLAHIDQVVQINQRLVSKNGDEYQIDSRTIKEEEDGNFNSQDKETQVLIELSNFG